MDHFLQIPQVGPHWEDMLESWTTLAFLAARTETATLGTLVTGVTYRNIAHLAKIVATLDVLSGGRAVCGIGAAWFERSTGPTAGRSRRWPTATPSWRTPSSCSAHVGQGRAGVLGPHDRGAEAVCYPRPLQDHVPILVGGSGERRTLRLVAQHADACNVFGDPDTVRRKVDVLHRHCADVGGTRPRSRSRCCPPPTRRRSRTTSAGTGPTPRPASTG